MAILDQWGKPMKRETLTTEVATPDTVGVRRLLGDQQTNGLNPDKLARIMRQADENDMTAYMELAEEIEEKDTHYLAVLSTRKRAVSQLEITVEAASDSEEDQANAKLVSDFLDRDELQGEIFDLLDAIGKGFSATEIIWDINSDVWMPKELKWRDPRFFQFDKKDGETLLLRDGHQGIPLDPYKFIIHKHKAKSGLTVRGGVIRPCAWMWLFKNFSIKDWVIFAEAYGQPIRVGSYGPSASKDDKNILMRAVASIGSDAAAIIPESMKIEFIESAGKTSTAEVFEKLCTFCDLQISKAILGQTTTTDAVSGGHAVSKEHNEVRGDIEQADAKQLASTLNAQLVIPMIALNRGPQKKYPRLRIGRAEQIDAVAYAGTADKAIRMGIPISLSKTRDKLGLDAPVDDDDILTFPAAAPTQEPDDEAEEVTTKTTASARPQSPARDEIDIAVEELASQYEEVMNPVVDLLQKAADESKDFDEFKQKLLEISGSEDMALLGEKLAATSFMARMAGNVGMPLSEDDA